MSKELEALKGIKKAIAEHLHKKTGVSVEKHFEYLQNDTEISIVEQALKQAQKQEELLKLYQKLYKDFDDITLSEIILIKNKIKELENE